MKKSLRPVVPLGRGVSGGSQDSSGEARVMGVEGESKTESQKWNREPHFIWPFRTLAGC